VVIKGENMIIGHYITSFDKEKRRVAIPKKFRQALGDELIIARWYEGCLVVVSKKSWALLMDRVTGKTRVVTSPVRDTDRFILGSAHEFSPDNQGRVVLPDYLSSHANLGSEVVFVGLGDRIEIWDKKEWEKRESYLSAHAGELIERLADEYKEI